VRFAIGKVFWKNHAGRVDGGHQNAFDFNDLQAVVSISNGGPASMPRPASPKKSCRQVFVFLVDTMSQQR
jgi:hypothetical protein